MNAETAHNYVFTCEVINFDGLINQADICWKAKIALNRGHNFRSYSRIEGEYARENLGMY